MLPPLLHHASPFTPNKKKRGRAPAGAGKRHSQPVTNTRKRRLSAITGTLKFNAYKDYTLFEEQWRSMTSFDTPGSSSFAAIRDIKTELWLAARDGHLETVRYLSEQNPDLILARNKDGTTVLNVAVYYGQLDIVRYLIEHHSHKLTTMTDKDGWTALHMAALNGHLETVRYLKEQNPNLILVLNKGDCATVLHVASWSGQLDTVRYLIEQHRGLLRMKGRGGWTALHFAAKKGHFEIICCLLKEDRDLIKMTTNNGETAMHLAHKYGHSKIVVYFSEQNRHELSVDDDGQSFELRQGKKLNCDFSKNPDIGSTSYADVYKGTLHCAITKESKYVAVKRYKLLNSKGLLKRDQFETEIKNLDKASGDYVVKLLDYFYNSEKKFIVMELFPGNLEQYLSDNEAKLSPDEYGAFLKTSVKQLMKAYNYLHSIAIYHRDVKPQNILYCELIAGERWPRLKLCDFAFSKIRVKMSEACESTTLIVSKNQNIRWSPPEMTTALQRSKYNPEKVDIWSLGHVFFYLAVRGKHGIFAVDGSFQDHDTQVRNRLEHDVQPTYPLCAHLIRMMMRQDPLARKPISALSGHPFTWSGKDFREQLERLYSETEVASVREQFNEYFTEATDTPWSEMLPPRLRFIMEQERRCKRNLQSNELGQMLIQCRNFLVHHAQKMAEYEKTFNPDLPSETVITVTEEHFFSDICSVFPDAVIKLWQFMKKHGLIDHNLLQKVVTAPDGNYVQILSGFKEDTLPVVLLSAIERSRQDIVDALLKWKPDVLLHEKSSNVLWLAIDKKVDMLVAIIEAASNIPDPTLLQRLACDDNETTVFQWAVRQQKPILTVIGKFPVVISWTDGQSRNLLHYAAQYGLLLLVQKILKTEQGKAALSDGDINANLPVHDACRNADHSVLGFLLQYLVEQGDQLLLEYHNKSNKNGETPLILACQANLTEHVNALLNCYATLSGTTDFKPRIHQNFISAADSSGNTPLHYAFINGNADLQKLLLERGADNQRLNKGQRRPAELGVG